MGKLTESGAQEKRLAGYMDGLAKVVGHADRATPLKTYCTGLLLPGERKSVEPMAARLAPDNVRQMHQSLHHLVATAPWKDESILEQVRGYVLTAMKSKGPVQAWEPAAGPESSLPAPECGASRHKTPSLLRVPQRCPSPVPD